MAKIPVVKQGMTWYLSFSGLSTCSADRKKINYMGNKSIQ